MDNNEFKTRINELFGSQKEAADALGLTIDQVKKMASGATPINDERLEIIRRVFADKEQEKTLIPAGIVLLDVDQLEGDGTNVRTKMNPGKLAELAASINTYGVQQNLQVYQTKPGLSGPMFKVIVGNRRLAASRMVVDRLAKDDPELSAARRLIPCKVLKTPEEIGRAKEIQLVENLQREDISPTDEARGFIWLSEEKGLNVPEIARRIGVSAKYVSQRMVLLRCPESFLDALDAGTIGTRHCEMVGRIPNKGDRERCAKMALKPKGLARPLTQAELETLIHSEFMVDLRKAPFDRSDETLEGRARSCDGCEFRSGNMEDLAGEISEVGKGKVGQKGGLSGLVCTNPTCYRAKCDSFWDREKERAEGSGQAVLEDSKARKVFTGAGGSVGIDSDFVELDGKPGPKDVGHFDPSKVPTWKEALKKAGVELSPILARHPETQKPVLLIDRAAAKEAIRAAAKAAGRKETLFEGADGEESAKRENQKNERNEKKARLAHTLKVAEKFGDQLAKSKAEDLPDIITALVGVVIERDQDAEFFLTKMLGIKTDSKKSKAVSIVEFIQSSKRTTAFSLAYLAIACLAYGLRWNFEGYPDFAEMAELIGFEIEPFNADSTPEGGDGKGGGE